MKQALARVLRGFANRLDPEPELPVYRVRELSGDEAAEILRAFKDGPGGRIQIGNVELLPNGLGKLTPMQRARRRREKASMR